MLRLVIEVGDRQFRTQGTERDIASEFESLLEGADSGYAFPELDENTRATTFYTTGTTGLPKGVYFSHRQLVLHTLAVRSALSGTGHGRLNADDVYMPLTPMFHVHAWGLPYVATTLGAKQVYPGRYQPDVLLELVRREKVTFSNCVPTILQMLLASARTKGDVDVSTLADWVGACAAALSPLVELIRRHVLGAARIHGDDTTVPVLAKGKTVTGRLWTYVRDDRPFGGPDPPAAVYFYSRNRDGEHPRRHLADYGRCLCGVQRALRSAAASRGR